MGDPRKLTKKYEPPKHPWEAARIKEENRLVREYGLRNKKEVWVAEAVVRKYRRLTKQLMGAAAEARQEKEKALLSKLKLLGLMKESATLDDVLSLRTEDLLARRLQTIVWKRGLASTVVQARQLIIHGHIALGGRKTTTPGMLLDVNKETLIGWHGDPIQLIFKKAAAEPPKPEEKKTEPAKPKEGEANAR
jgi:small subunit ribosomal protein S4